MTTLEHALLGSTGAVALGLHRRGWQIVALAGVAAVLPDWDGLSLLFGAAAFDQFHRAVGHSIFIATAVAILAAAVEYRVRWMARCGAVLARYVEGIPAGEPHDASQGRPAVPGAKEGILLWTAVAVVATWSHLAADLLFSGHATLADWGLKLFWPLSQQTYVFPAIRWGDPLPTVLLVAGMFAMLRWRNRAQPLAALTILAMAGYTTVRAFLLPY